MKSLPRDVGTVRYRLLALAIILTLGALTAVILPALGAGQEKERTVKIKTFPNQPVDIVDIKVKGAYIGVGQKVAGDRDWMKGMTVTIKNVSDKPVVYVTISVGAKYEKNGVRRRTSDGRDYVAATTIGYGLRPPLPGEPPRSVTAAPLLPGQISQVVLPEAKRDELYRLLKLEDASTDLAELSLTVDHVAWYGEDDKMWSNGRVLRRDANDPNHWMPIDDPDQPQLRLNHAARRPPFELASMFGIKLTPRHKAVDVARVLLNSTLRDVPSPFHFARSCALGKWHEVFRI